MAATAERSVRVILSAVDRMTGPLKRISEAFRPVQTEASKTDAALKRFSSFRSEGVTSAMGRVSASIGKVGQNLKNVITLGGTFGAVLSGGALAAAGAGAKSVIEVSAQFEKFENVLTTLYKSSDQAKKAMSWISDFAAKTPYEVADTTEAFMILRRSGLDPMNGSLKAIGDAAAGSNKPIKQAAEAIADAVMGENERLKELGINAKVEKDKIEYTWMEGSKQFRAIADKDNKAQIARTITGIWNRQYGGAMEKLSKTWDGMVSTLKDSWSQGMLAIGKAGVFDWLKARLERLLGAVDRFSKDGRLEKWAKRISDAMIAVFTKVEDFVTNFDMDKAIEEFNRILGIAKTVSDFFGGPLNTALIAIGAITFGPLIASVIALGAALLATPAGQVVVLAGLIAGAVKLIYDNWEPLSKWWQENWRKVLQYTPYALFMRTIGEFGKAVSKFIDDWKPTPEWWRQMWSNLIEATPGMRLFRTIQDIGGFVKEIYDNWGRLPEWWKEKWDTIISQWPKMDISILASGMGSTAEFVKDKWGPLVEFFQDLWNKIKPMFLEFTDWIYSTAIAPWEEAGSKLVNAIWEGMKIAWEDLKGWFKKQIDELLALIPDFLKGGPVMTTPGANPAPGGVQGGALAPRGSEAETTPSGAVTGFRRRRTSDAGEGAARPTASLASLGADATRNVSEAGTANLSRRVRIDEEQQSELATAIKRVAAENNWKAEDLATIMSYETGGTLHPWQKGPTTKWGQHRGLIQWGQQQRNQYGINENSTITQQVEASAKYLRDRGVAPGAGLLPMYSAINAGGVSERHFNMRDAAAGGAPGTVRDKVNFMLRGAGGHTANARALLGKANEGEQIRFKSREELMAAINKPMAPAVAAAEKPVQASVSGFRNRQEILDAINKPAESGKSTAAQPSAGLGTKPDQSLLSERERAQLTWAEQAKVAEERRNQFIERARAQRQEADATMEKAADAKKISNNTTYAPNINVAVPQGGNVAREIDGVLQKHNASLQQRQREALHD